MKRLIGVIAVLMAIAMTVQAQNAVEGVRIDALRMERNGESFAVEMKMILDELQVENNRAVLLTPHLVNGVDSIVLPSVGIYGRQRYYYYVRAGESMLTGKTETSFRAKERPPQMDYQQLLPYEEWMNGAVLSLYRQDYGCCSSLLVEQNGRLGEYLIFTPQLVYVCPQVEEVKSRSLEGSAYIDFPVSRTEIRPDYRNNQVELAKIQATIDSVRNDRDILITSVWLKGFASPEGSYTNNARLAKGRTAALQEYIRGQYQFEESVLKTESEPEDWAGLRRYVEQSSLEHRSEILALIDGDTEPDVKERNIKTTYPQEYSLLLKEAYPALRHTDYRIAYTIRSYSDVEEIKRVMKLQPQKLSLNEFYLVAQTYEPGTPEFTEVFETAVRMYPSDETANLNAANTALQTGQWAMAVEYLQKAGQSPQAIYARGVHAYLTEDYASAEKYFAQAKAAGITEATAALEASLKMKK